MKEVALTNGGVTMIDDQDYLRVTRYRWRGRKDGKADGYVKELGKTILLHRFLMNAPTGIQVDHKNNNGLDNQRSLEAGIRVVDLALKTLHGLPEANLQPSGIAEQPGSEEEMG